MFNLFRRKPLLSDDDQYFQIECYKWLLTYFGGNDFYHQAQLVLPTKKFFPERADSKETAARATFDQVKKYAGLEGWPCKLESQEEQEIKVAPAMVLQNVKQNPLGTFSSNENSEIIITYNPKIVSNPTQMVATFAHELSHYLTATAPQPPPGGWENWEFATDIGATFLGFGVFQANATINFQQYADIDSQGWEVSGGGYLTEAEHSYALAIFLILKNISPDIAYPYCKANTKSFLRKAIKELENSDEIEMLKALEYAPGVS